MITCTFDNGTRAPLRHVSTASLVIRGNQILVTRRSKNISEGGLLCVPGGYLDRDETLMEGAVREVLEETGYQVSDPQLLFVIDNPDRRHQENQTVDFVYLVTLGSKVAEPDHETTEVMWLDLDKLPREEEWAFDHWQYIERYRKSVR